MSDANSEVVESMEGSQVIQETKTDSSQHDTLEHIEAASHVSAGGLESPEKEKSKDIHKRSTSTPEIKVSKSHTLRQSKNVIAVHSEEGNLEGSLKSQHKEIPSEDEPQTAESFIRSILAELLAHVPSGGSDYKTSADSIVRGILSDMLVQVVPEKTRSGESVVRGVLSEVLSRMSNEINVHRISLDCEYLKEHLGGPLTLGLSEVIIKRPVDPIHYLAHWLFKWRWNQQQKQIKEEEINALTVERERKLAEIKEKERLEAERRAELERIRQANEAAADTLDIVLNRAFEMISQAGEAEEEGEMEMPPDME